MPRRDGSKHRLVAPLTRKLLFETVAEELGELILTGELQPGAKLPSENDLAAQFGVSRNVVREGIRSLIEQGLVAVRPGDGIYVQVPDESTVVNAFSRRKRTMTGMSQSGGSNNPFFQSCNVRYGMPVSSCSLFKSPCAGHTAAIVSLSLLTCAIPFFVC